MPVIKCPLKSCTYETLDVDASIAILCLLYTKMSTLLQVLQKPIKEI